MTKLDRVYVYMWRRLQNKTQPQLFGLPKIHKDLNVPRSPGGGSFIDNALGCLRRAGKLNEVGKIGGGIYYVLKPSALRQVKKDPTLLRLWLSSSHDRHLRALDRSRRRAIAS